ncbi:phosphohydrolase [Massilia sp. Root133]|uniref:Phosphohydrolase n=1 Tax=Massilia cellulosiltytica TaxID=2683234 RepID=A0A7X3FVG0_9BURK|nr:MULTISPECIES: HD domain-containing phosphohydrolase [Telluria group]KQY13526.1 phosphohydrolase [Massilia sp. Root133]KQZ47651.1 phosphohydrolase [Massilia sp. Root1485]MVW58588.1 phosphohydrolase [Telluria cellulosilytica]
MQSDETITVEDAVQVLAMVGDLSMGLPPDHSIRTARLAARLAEENGDGADACTSTRMVALLRWSGSTATAAGFAHLLGDDVRGRHAMVTRTLSGHAGLTFANVMPLAQMQCEVAGDIAVLLGLPGDVENSLRHLFGSHHRGDMQEVLFAPNIPRAVFYVRLAGDLEVLAPAHGTDGALRLIGERAGVKYPATLVQRLSPHAQDWLGMLEEPSCAANYPGHDRRVPLSIVADVIELKLPWLTGYSRRVAALARRSASLAGMMALEESPLVRAALLHGIGKVAVPNVVWERPGKLDADDWDQVRKVPFWTARAGTQIPAIQNEATLASFIYERLDGSGYFRKARGEALGMQERLLGATAAFVSLCSPRPWRPAHGEAAASTLMTAQAAAGRFDRQAVEAVLAAARGPAQRPPVRDRLLSDRELEVLRHISQGETSREAARAMRITPASVRMHVDNIFQKLESGSRPAATLKALARGLI